MFYILSHINIRQDSGIDRLGEAKVGGNLSRNVKKN